MGGVVRYTGRATTDIIQMEVHSFIVLGLVVYMNKFYNIVGFTSSLSSSNLSIR